MERRDISFTSDNTGWRTSYKGKEKADIAPVPDTKQTVFFIEGIIGVGKSFILDALRTKYRHALYIIPEPLDLWQNYYVDVDDGTNIFERYYKDPVRWSLTFQYVAMKTRYDYIVHALNVCKKEPWRVIVAERSLIADSVFVEALHNEKKMDGLEFMIHSDHIEHYQNLIEDAVSSVYIYLKDDVDACLKRIKDRKRDGEEDITKEYLEQLDTIGDKVFEMENNVQKIRQDVENFPMVLSKIEDILGLSAAGVWGDAGTGAHGTYP